MERHQYATPTLMRSARGAYAQSIRAHLHAIGIDDLPRNGALILAEIDPAGGPGPDLPPELGVTKQAVSQVIDHLVDRGYLERHPDPDGRRRVALQLTERGEEVLQATFRGVEAVDRQLEAHVSPQQIDAMRTALIALTEIKVDAATTGAGRRRPATRLRRFSPIFPVPDLGAARAHYAALGFATVADDDGADYGFARRDGVELHLEVSADHDGPDGHHGHHGHHGSAYLYVRDADALYEEWSRPGIGGHTHAPETTPYEMREGHHVDPDGNLIRFGSPVEQLTP